MREGGRETKKEGRREQDGGEKKKTIKIRIEKEQKRGK